MSKKTAALSFIAGAAVVLAIQHVHARITFVEAPADLPQTPQPVAPAQPQRVPRPAQRRTLTAQPRPHKRVR